MSRLSEESPGRYFLRLAYQPVHSHCTMPTYEYRCPECRNQFEKFQKMSDEPIAECPACGARAERRLSGGAGFLFKGSGFYITDYRSDSYKKAAGSESGAGSGGSEGKADGGASGGEKTSKPAASEKGGSTPAPETRSGGSKPKAE
jgi:putative FmdB family regulatory protein